MLCRPHIGFLVLVVDDYRLLILVGPLLVGLLVVVRVAVHS